MSVRSACEHDEVLPLQSTIATTIASTPTDECSLSQRRDARKATNSDQFSRSSSRCSGWTAASPSLGLSLSRSDARRPILTLLCFRGFLPEKAAQCHAAGRWVLRVLRSQRRFWRAGSRRPITCCAPAPHLDTLGDLLSNQLWPESTAQSGLKGFITTGVLITTITVTLP